SSRNSRKKKNQSNISAIALEMALPVISFCLFAGWGFQGSGPPLELQPTWGAWFSPRPLTSPVYSRFAFCLVRTLCLEGLAADIRETAITCYVTFQKLRDDLLPFIPAESSPSLRIWCAPGGSALDLWISEGCTDTGLESAGAVFTNGIGPGARLRMRR